MNLSEPSKFWPVLKRSAELTSHVKVPGMDITFDKVISILAGIQDDLTKNKWEDEVKQALNAVRNHTQLIAQELTNLRINLSPQELSDGMLELTERHYRLTTANEYLYADFKGIEQNVHFVSLELDELFVDLHTRPESLDERDRQIGQTLRERLLKTHGELRDQVVQELEEFDARATHQLDRLAATDVPQSIDQVLCEPGGKILLGGPGSGKTTLVKRLARSCALGDEVMQARYPAMPDNLLPVVISITLFNDWCRDGRGLWEYIKYRLHAPRLSHRNLARLSNASNLLGQSAKSSSAS